MYCMYMLCIIVILKIQYVSANTIILYGEFEVPMKLVKVPMKLVKVVEIWFYYNNSTCFVHVYLLSSTYVALRQRLF